MQRLLVIFALVGLIGPAVGSADVISSGGDSWAREADPGATFAGDLISVWATTRNDGGGANARYGTIEFDLSAQADPITDVGLSLYSGLNGFSDDATPLVQTAIAIDPTGLGNADALSWSDVTGAAVLHTFGSLGAYDLPAVDVTPAIQNVYVESVGSAADVAFVESVRTGSGRLMILLIADEDGEVYSKSWGDGEFTGSGTDPLLRTNGDVIPEPGSLFLLMIGLIVGCVRKRSK